MNGSTSPRRNVEPASRNSEDAPPEANGHHSPDAARSPTAGRPAQSAGAQPEPSHHGSDPVQRTESIAVNGGNDDANSEAETLIESPVKKREAEKAKQQAVKTEKPIKSRIGGLPVPGEDDDEDESISTPIQSTEMSDAKAGSSGGVRDEVDEDEGEEMDLGTGSDKENSSGSLSSARSSGSSAHSRTSSLTRALSERPNSAQNGGGSPNPRKRKHRASSVGLPRKRQSMDPPKRKLRGMYSEDNAIRADRSPTPKLRSHRRTASTQSAFMDGTAEGVNRQRRAITQFPVRDLKPGKTAWEESDASSETTSHGNIEARRPQRGIGRSTSTPGRPPAREHKRHVNKYGFTRLAEACEIGDMETIKEWREKDPDQLELAEFAGNKPLQIAALNGQDEVVEYLINQGCQIDCANVDKDTPLIDAAENGHSEVVKILLDAGVDPLRQNLKGQQALDVVTDDTDDADEIRAALRQAIESWNSDGAKQRREEEEEQRHRAGPSKELHFMARSSDNLLRLVQINDRNGVREFLDARVPVDNVVIAAAAKTGDQYLMNMLLAEMTEKKAHSKPEKPMLAVLGTSHFDMVKLLTELDSFKPMWRSRQKNKTWPELAEEKQGPHWRQEVELLQRLYDKCEREVGRQSSSPVTMREGSKRRVPHDGSDDDSDEADVPKRKNGRRLMSRRDMRAASGKPPSESESEEEYEPAETMDLSITLVDPEPPTQGETSMKPPESPNQRRGVGRPRTKSLSSQSGQQRDVSSPKGRRRSSILRGLQEMAMPTVKERVEEKMDEDGGADKQKVAEAMFAIQEAQRLEAKQREEEAAEAEAKKAEKAAKKADEERRAEESRQREAEARRVEEEAKRAEEVKRAEDARRQREVEMEGARRIHIQDVLASLPKVLAHVLNPDSTFKYKGVHALGDLEEYFTPLLVVKEDDSGPWVLNVQAAPLLGKRGLELLLPGSSDLDFQLTFGREWSTHTDLFPRERYKVQHVISALAEHEGPTEEPTGSPTTDGDVAISNIEHSHSDFQAELRRAAARLNATHAAETRLNNSTIVPLYCVKLSDVLANLDPLVKDTSIDVDYLPPTGKAVEVTATLDGRGVESFLARTNAYSGNTTVCETYKTGRLKSEMGMSAGKTDVVVVHEK